MNVKLEWQVGESPEDDAWEWRMLLEDAQLDPTAIAVGVERHPELLRLRIGSRAERRDSDPYLLLSLMVFAFLMAMYLLV